MVFNSCTSVKNLAGTYNSNKVYTTIQLNEDSTFFYRYKFEFDERHSDGVWKKIGNNKVMLNSSMKNRLLPIVFETAAANNAGNERTLSVSIFHMPESEKTFYQCSFFINDKYYVTRSCNSLSRIALVLPVHNVYLGISGNEKMPGRFTDTLYTQKAFPVITSNNNTDLKLQVDFKDSLFNYRVIENEILKVTNKGLKVKVRNDWHLLYKTK